MAAGSGLPDLQGLFTDLGKWSRLGMHVKRWILLLVISCTAISLGIAFLLVQVYRTQPFPEWVYYVTLQNLDRSWRALIFLVFGVGGVGFSVVQLNRSLLLAVQPPYEQGRLVDIVYNYRLPQRRPHVVAIAGHRGFVALQHHRERYADRLTGISSVGDGLMPPAIEVEIARGASDRVLQPVDEHVTLCAELEHGTILTGADAIRARRGGVPIKRVFLIRPGEDATQVARANTEFVGACPTPVKPEVLQAIEEADVIVFGPGAFYVSIVPNLLLADVSGAIRASRARKVLIANLMTEPGQTDLYDVGDYVRAIHAYGGFTLDYVVVNSAYSDRVLNERYAASLATPVFAENSVDGGAGRAMRKVGSEDGAIVIAADIASRMAERVPIPAGSRDVPPGGAATTSIAVYRHDPAKLAGVLASLLGVTERGLA
ncbi:MAG: YvcK family protein [Chloroflexi bacterium]|jgi:hypothetical protein|nr:YvcK family protein [Chloroflexota bacterium]